MITYYIYTLTNPKNGEIFYVGCTANPTLRFRQHCFANGPTKKDKYIKNMGCLPIMDIVHEIVGVVERKRVMPFNVKEAEYLVTEKYLKAGHILTNVVHAHYYGFGTNPL